ncbi:MAG: hypothetical protein HY928_08085 [Elusimicrobia bacterium]|nr:hypothetical protein [Elusimicrobiota bacterium]
MLRPLAAALCALLAAAPTSAQVGGLFEGRRGKAPAFSPLVVPEVKGEAKGWQPAAPDEEPGDTNPGAPERSGFWDRLQNNAFDQICKNIKLKHRQSVAVDGVGGAGVTVNRELQRTAAGTFALVDRASLDLSLGLGQSLFQDAVGGVGLSVGASVSGESAVIRPLGTKKSCDEVKRLVNVFDFKAALPLSAERVARMQVGELWRIPLTLHIGAGIGASLGELPASISLGRGKEGRVSATLFRLSEDQVRFRLRIDKADIRNRGGEVVYSIPGAALGFPEVDTIIVEQLVKLVNRQVARSLSRYLTARIGLAQPKRTGRMILIEFILDPRDQAQMTALRQLMRGDLNALSLLWDLLSKAGRALNGDRRAEEEAGEVVDRHSQELGRRPDFVGADDYERRNSRFWFKLPILVDHENNSGRERDTVLIVDETGGQYEVHKADKRKETGWLDVPFLGEMNKHNTQRTAQVMTYRDAAGNSKEPVAVFLRQEGFLRSGAGTARGMAEEADAITRLIGTRGNGTNDGAALPVETLFPKDSLTVPAADHGPRDTDTGPTEKTYHRGISAFTLVFGRKAVEDIVSAPADVVLRSYVNALGYAEQELMKRVLPLLRIEEGGKVSYRERDALKALGYDGWRDENASGALSELSQLAQTATGLIQDLAKARAAASPEDRAKLFLEVMAGDGRAGLAYEAAMKVLVQMADPADVAGEFFVNVEKGRKGEKDVTARLLLNKDLGDGAFIGEASRNRARFAEPSILVD